MQFHQGPGRDRAVLEPIQGTATERRPPGPALWLNHNFNVFWAARTLNAFGDAYSMLALPLLLLNLTGSVAKMGLATGAAGFGNLIAGLVSAVIGDRVDRRRVIIFCDVTRSALYALIPISWLLLEQLWVIYSIAVLAGFLTTSVLITHTAAVTSAVDQEQIVQANGRLQATVAASYVLGPMVAGFVSHRLGFLTAVGAVFASYAGSAALMAIVRLKASTSSGPQSEQGRIVPTRSVQEGVRFLFALPVLRAVLLLMAACAFLSEAFIDLAVFHLKQDLRQGEDTVGLVFGFAGLGAIAAGGLVSRLRRRYGFGVCFLGSMALQGAAIASIGLSGDVVLIVVVAICYAMANSVLRVISMSLRQVLTPERLMGRVTGVFWTLLTVLGAAGVATLTLAAHEIGAPATLVLAGGLTIVVCVIGTLTPAREREPECC